MATYHLYYLRGSELIGSDDIEAPDGREAARIARERGQGEAVEIWDDSARIRIVAPRATAQHRL